MRLRGVCTLTLAAVMLDVPPSAAIYTIRWLVVELHSLTVTPGCLIAAMCGEPRLRTTLFVDEALVSSSIPLNTSDSVSVDMSMLIS